MCEAIHIVPIPHKELRATGEALFKAKAKEQKLEVLTTRVKSTGRSVFAVNGKLCKVVMPQTIQKQDNQRRIYTKAQSATMRKVHALAIMLLVPEVHGRILIIPAQTILDAHAHAERKTVQLTLPLHEKKGYKARIHDWWQYEDNWDLFTAPQH